jgi:hypothetical protein
MGGRNQAAHGACMPPSIQVSPRGAPPGSTVTITGTGWKEGCNDTVQCPQSGPCSVDESKPARTGIELRFSQGRNSDGLGTVDAGNDSRFTYTAVIPMWAKTGAATLKADEVITGFSVKDAASGAPAGLATLVSGRDLAAGGAGDAGLTGGSGEPLPRTGFDGGLALAGAGACLAAAAALRRATA